MPIYEYRCAECEQIFEEWQKGFEDKNAPCPVCGHKAKRIISNTAFVLKGTGWYVTDYCRGGTGNGHGNGHGNGKAKDASSSSDSSSSSDAPPKTVAAESKPAQSSSPAS